jgi:tetraacyldisaccharide 4'-kinase
MSGALIRRAWERTGLSGKIAWLALLPLSLAYRLAIGSRNLLYRLHWLPVRALDRPVISIGNLTVGGTGKTPSCIWLAQELQKRGLKVAILTRGYKRKQAGLVIITGHPDGKLFPNGVDELAAAGDEPFMMARLYGQTVAVGRDRYRAGRELLNRQEVDVFLLDDGFQHRQLKRDFDLLLLGNDLSGTLLPAGPFREPVRAARRTDCVLVTGGETHWREAVKSFGAMPCFFAAIGAVGLGAIESNRWVEHPISFLFHSKILAVAGIANPENFYRTLHESGGEIVDTLEFSDHHDYTSQDWQEINRAARSVDLIVTTEKDLVKLARFPFAREKLMALRIAMQVDQGEKLVNAVIERVAPGRTQGIALSRYSSAPGDIAAELD